MKRDLMADRLVAMSKTGDEMIERARNLLILPVSNHIPSDFRGACDRFVLEPGFGRACMSRSNNFDEKTRLGIWANARPPLPQCWIEDGSYGKTFAWLFDGNFVGFYVMSGSDVVPLFSTPLTEMIARGSRTVQLSLTEYVRSFAVLVDVPFDDLCRLFFGGATIIAAITSPRAATAERIVPSVSSGAERAFARRRAQRGRPVFSYNRVKLVLPKTCIYRGEVRESRAFAGMRGHMVIGHWRLIAGVLEPFFVWIEGHSRCEDSPYGWVTKERRVTVLNEFSRRGFVVPQESGRVPVERRKAMGI